MTGSDQHPWSFPSTEWSAPEIYHATATLDADPPGAVALDVPGPLDVSAKPEALWGETTYSGPRRYRPRPGQPEEAAEPPAVDESDQALLSHSKTMAVASLASRITGFLRSVALAAALGVTASRVADSYNIANTLPNMVYELLLGGVLSSVIVPLIVNAQEKDSDHGTAYTQRLLTLAVTALGLATMIAVMAAPLLAWAYGAGHDQRQLTSVFATLLLPEIFFYGLGAMFAAILNTRGVFGPPAWAPVLNNVVTIATVAVFALLPSPNDLTASSITTAQVLVLGIGTTLGIALQALFLVPFLLRTGFRWQWRWRATGHETGRMSEVRTLASWVLGYVFISQIGLFVLTRVANNYQGGPTTFVYADLLFQVPYGILGVSLLTALMPRMSRSAARGDPDAVVADLSLGARLSAVALVPISAGLMVLGPSLTTMLFFYGRTSLADARHIGVVLALGAFGLLPFAMVMLQMRVFYANRDARTPTLINVFMVTTKIVLVLIASQTLSGPHVIESLSVATSTSYVVGAYVGYLLLRRRYGNLGFRTVASTVGRACVASAVGAGVAYLCVLASEHLIGTGRSAAALALVSGSVLGGALYLLVARALDVTELSEILGSLRGRSAVRL
ncbi:MAG TPA: murein biosynthesis integral membrane protein MurJ [Jatrophihabitantaceae bacterium]|nr:murein biosynthesis integral membrane protein MurJ [Jatrophihabitantaceae bacterium]